ncbi:unnamed protein product, partial [Staurois parvus]
MLARSCDQLCPITADHMQTRKCRSLAFSLLSNCHGDMYTDHQGTDDQCALMISVAPAVPPVSASCQCHVLVPISATSMPHISAHLSCLSVSSIS